MQELAGRIVGDGDGLGGQLVLKYPQAAVLADQVL